ncbi:MAG: PAS domain-containing protein [Pseudobdellovibrio sp.]
MRITTQLRIISIGSIAVLLVLVPFLKWSFAEHKSAKKNSYLADQIQVSLIEGASFLEQYLLFREIRAKQLWEKNHLQINNLLIQGNGQFSFDEVKLIIIQIQKNQESGFELFRRIVHNTDQIISDSKSRQIFEELDRRLFNQILLKYSNSRDAASVLLKTSEQQADLAYNRLMATILVLIIILSLITILSSIRLSRITRIGLARLHEGANIIASGDLAYRIKLKSTNEFSELAVSINEMTIKLQANQKQLENEINERKVIESKLLIENLKVKEITAGIEASAIVAVTDANGIINYVNDKFSEISGFSKSELIGNTYRIVNSGFHPKEFFSDLWKTISSGQIWRGEICNKRKDGTLYWVETVISKVHDSFGAVQYFAIRFDITKRKAAEESLQKSEQLWKFALEGAGDGVWDWNIPSKQVYFSKRWKEMLGYQDAEIPADIEEWKKRVHPDDLQGVEKAFRSHLEGKTSYQSEHRMLCKDKTYLWVLDRGMVISYTSEGSPLRMVGTHTDISKIKQAEAKLVQASKLASLGEMSAGVAHEINNPLTIITVSARKIFEAKDKPKEVIARIEAITKASNRIARIVNGLQKYSRTTEGANYANHSLSNIVLESIILTESKTKLHQVSITTELTDESNIFCDEIEIEQVLINLISNAIDAIKELDEKWIKIEILKEPDVVILRLTDSGSGISDAVKNKIFDPFFTTKNVGEGTGLGLSIAKGILDNHKAIIAILENNINTCFEIRFPTQIN